MTIDYKYFKKKLETEEALLEEELEKVGRRNPDNLSTGKPPRPIKTFLRQTRILPQTMLRAMRTIWQSSTLWKPVTEMLKALWRKSAAALMASARSAMK